MPRVALDAIVNAHCGGINIVCSPSIVPFGYAVASAVADRAESFTRNKFSVCFIRNFASEKKTNYFFLLYVFKCNILIFVFRMKIWRPWEVKRVQIKLLPRASLSVKSLAKSSNGKYRFVGFAKSSRVRRGKLMF